MKAAPAREMEQTIAANVAGILGAGGWCNGNSIILANAGNLKSWLWHTIEGQNTISGEVISLGVVQGHGDRENP
jgi:hypothetical protein